MYNYFFNFHSPIEAFNVCTYYYYFLYFNSTIVNKCTNEKRNAYIRYIQRACGSAES